MFTKKIHSQPGPSTSSPPAIGPTRVATPAVAPHSAIACPRSLGANMRVIIDIVCGVIMPAPSPWTTRATMSISTLPARPHHRLEAVNMARPAMYIVFIPKRSPRRPVISSGTA